MSNEVPTSLRVPFTRNDDMYFLQRELNRFAPVEEYRWEVDTVLEFGSQGMPGEKLYKVQWKEWSCKYNQCLLQADIHEDVMQAFKRHGSKTAIF